MRLQTLRLRETLKTCSPLGALMRDPQAVGIGWKTLRTLEANGVRDWKELLEWSESDFLRAGLQPKARQ